MSYIRVALIGLAIAFITPSLASAGFASGSANFSRSTYCTTCVLAQYITTEQQRQQAQQNLERHREQQQQGGSNSSVQSSTNSVQNSTNTYGKEWQEQQLQGNTPRVNRSW
jgi:hypothetical protein